MSEDELKNSEDDKSSKLNEEKVASKKVEKKLKEKVDLETKKNISEESIKKNGDKKAVSSEDSKIVSSDSSNLEESVSEKKEKKVTSSEDSKTESSGSKNLEKSVSKNEKLSKNKDNNKQPRNNSSNKNYNEENEFIEKLVSINRVAKVVKGGRRFSFAALVVVGDGNGMVGHGKGKAKEVPEAIKKATDEAKARMIRVPLRQARTLHHDITGRYDAGKVKLRSAPSGTGVIAGGPMRSVFEALGVKDIVAKSIGSSNPHNMIRATFDALSSASSPKLISVRRGLKVNEITKRRKGALNQESGDA